jgi:hypothetical protein
MPRRLSAPPPGCAHLRWISCHLPLFFAKAVSLACHHTGFEATNAKVANSKSLISRTEENVLKPEVFPTKALNTRREAQNE